MKKTAVINGESVVVIEEQILKFQQHIESILEEQQCSCLEAISQYCESNDVDIFSVKHLISAPLMQKLKTELIGARLLKESPVSVLFGV